MNSTKKVAIVTGAGRGIGRGIALQLAQAGWQIVVHGVGSMEAQQETLELIRKENTDGILVKADISSSDDREALVEKTLAAYGRIDMLVNNSGIGPRVRLDVLDTTEESMNEVLNVNLIGPFFLTQMVVNHMLKMIDSNVIDSGKIVNIGSISAYTSSISRGEYCISKAGVAMSTLLFADRLAEHKINVYEIRPGIVETPMTAGVKDEYDKLIAGGLTPIRRWGQPDDVGRAVRAIAEDYLPFSTGQVIDVDGGFHMHRL